MDLLDMLRLRETRRRAAAGSLGAEEPVLPPVFLAALALAGAPGEQWRVPDSGAEDAFVRELREQLPPGVQPVRPLNRRRQPPWIPEPELPRSLLLKVEPQTPRKRKPEGGTV